MNIGILTYHFVSNFGANLQTLSTYKYIENAGHTPIIINWIPVDLEKYYEENVSQHQNKAHRLFAQNNYKNITTICRTTRDIAQVIDDNKIDLVVIGSDAVFTYIPPLARIHICRRGLVYCKPCIDSDFPNPFWGDFIEHTSRKIKVAIMSASAQNTKYRMILGKRLKRKFCDSIGLFNYISVRDVWTQEMLSYLTNGQVFPKITPDPVFAFQYNVNPQKTQYVKHYFNIDCPYVIVSLTGAYPNIEWMLELEKIFAESGIALVGLPQTNKPFKAILRYNINFPLDPLEWYNIIRESSGYIGELMHPVLVSLHNSIPVYAFDKYGFKMNGVFDKKSSKTYQIMSRFDLTHNYYNKLMRKDFPTPTEVASAIFSFNRNKCMQYANSMLEQYKEMMTKIISL